MVQTISAAKSFSNPPDRRRSLLSGSLADRRHLPRVVGESVGMKAEPAEPIQSSQFADRWEEGMLRTNERTDRCGGASGGLRDSG